MPKVKRYLPRYYLWAIYLFTNRLLPILVRIFSKFREISQICEQGERKNLQVNILRVFTFGYLPQGFYYYPTCNAWRAPKSDWAMLLWQWHGPRYRGPWQWAMHACQLEACQGSSKNLMPKVKSYLPRFLPLGVFTFLPTRLLPILVQIF